VSSDFSEHMYLFFDKRIYTTRSESRCALRIPYSAVSRNNPRTLNELKTIITAYIRNISQSDLQKVFANEIKRIQACVDTRGHHFQRILSVHSDFSNADLQKGVYE
jgi:hypothetical protein